MNLTRCRICRGDRLHTVLDLGHTPLADDFLVASRLNESETVYPLRVVVCEDCRLVQLSYTVDRTTLYSADYPYLSSTTATGRAHYQTMASRIVDRFSTHGELAVDIGSNVGVLLDGFAKAGSMRVLGVEPVPPIAQIANLSGIETIAAFFSQRLAADIVASRGRASVITGTNVVAHIHDLHDLAQGIRTLLAPQGVFVFEAPYLGDLIDQCAYDTIYHEHLSYLALNPVNRLMNLYGLEVFDVEWQPIHGGTLRYFIAARGDYSVLNAVRARAVQEESRLDDDALTRFAHRVNNLRRDLVYQIADLRASGKTVAAVSAPAKGMTLLTTCGLSTHLIDFVTEKAESKIGRFTPGTHIPVLPDSALLERRPDYALLLAWNFADEIMANNAAYVERGGKFIIPIPSPRVAEPHGWLSGSDTGSNAGASGSNAGASA